MLTIAAGCGTGTEENNGSIQTVQETIPEENLESNSEGNPEVNPEGNPKGSQEGEVQNGAGEPRGEAAGEGMAEGNRADKENKATGTNGTELSGKEEISGEITSLADGSFIITKYYTEETEDGGKVMVSMASSAEGEEVPEEEFPSITVKYTENTAFEVLSIQSADGSDFSRDEGTENDLKTGVSVDITGSFQGEEFLADAITIVHPFSQK